MYLNNLILKTKTFSYNVQHRFTREIPNSFFLAERVQKDWFDTFFGIVVSSYAYILHTQYVYILYTINR